MQIDGRLTDQTVLAELGQRLSRWRVERNISQADFAEEAGIGRRTVQRLEAGESVQLESLIRVLRVLGLLGALDQLIPAPPPSPIERLARSGREPKRSRRRASGDAPADKPWRWGDESGDRS